MVGVGSISADGAARNIANPLVVLSNPNIGGSQNLTLSGPIDLGGFMRYIAVENFLAEQDGLLGNWGVNNFYLYRFQKQ